MNNEPYTDRVTAEHNLGFRRSFSHLASLGSNW